MVLLKICNGFRCVLDSLNVLEEGSNALQGHACYSNGSRRDAEWIGHAHWESQSFGNSEDANRGFD